MHVYLRYGHLLETILPDQYASQLLPYLLVSLCIVWIVVKLKILLPDFQQIVAFGFGIESLLLNI